MQASTHLEKGFWYDRSIATEEGQISIINNRANASDYSFEYYLRDHLGDTRPGWRAAGATEIAAGAMGLLLRELPKY